MPILNTKGEKSSVQKEKSKVTTWKAEFSENNPSESFSNVIGKFLDIRRKTDWTIEKKVS